MANYAKTNIGNEGRVELHETLSLTGAVALKSVPVYCEGLLIQTS